MANPIKIKAQVVSIEGFGTGTYRVQLEPLGNVPRYKPGQFLHLALDDYDPTGGFWPESRVFSIASAPGDALLEIIYSVKGRYTRRMEAALGIGSQVWLKLPYGNFIIDSAIAPNQNVVLVAGGTGLSPFLPYLKQVLAKGEGARSVRLYYGVREASMLLAHDLLQQCKAGQSIEARLFVENGEPGASVPAGIVAATGRLDIGRIYQESLELGSPVFFLSGPPTMISLFKDALLASNVAADRIIIDEWE